MKAQRLTIVLTVLNLVVLVLTATVGRTTAQTTATILRGHALELVDDQGQVRSRLNVESNGEVVLRLLDQSGAIRVKLGASAGGSGLLLLDEATEPAIQMIARRTATADTPTTTSLALRSTGGRERMVTPCRNSKRCGRQR
jgi:hypothetical protein